MNTPTAYIKTYSVYVNLTACNYIASCAYMAHGWMLDRDKLEKWRISDEVSKVRIWTENSRKRVTEPAKGGRGSGTSYSESFTFSTDLAQHFQVLNGLISERLAILKAVCHAKLLMLIPKCSAFPYSVC